MNMETTSGNRGLLQAEPLIFETGHATGTGVDLPEPKGVKDRLGGLKRKAALDLPGLSEPETMRHFVRLSQKNYAIDLGLFPLGSCTMKHNPRLNERVARMEGFADLHPLQPTATIQGALELMEANSLPAGSPANFFWASATHAANSWSLTTRISIGMKA